MKEFALPSQHKNLRGVVWSDVKNPIGTVQIAHGLAEYHGRYHEVAEFLNNKGFISQMVALRVILKKKEVIVQL